MGRSTLGVAPLGIVPNGSGVGRTSFAWQPPPSIVGTKVKLFRRPRCAAAFPALVKESCQMRSRSGPVFRVIAAVRWEEPTIGPTVMLSSPGAKPPALGLVITILLAPEFSSTGSRTGTGESKVLPFTIRAVAGPSLAEI